MMEFVSWDDDIPNWMENMFQTTNQYFMSPLDIPIPLVSHVSHPISHDMAKFR